MQTEAGEKEKKDEKQRSREHYYNQKQL